MSHIANYQQQNDLDPPRNHLSLHDIRLERMKDRMAELDIQHLLEIEKIKNTINVFRNNFSNSNKNAKD